MMKPSAVPEQDLDLDVESGLEAEKWMSKNGEEDKLTQDEEIDLTELEEVLEDVDLDDGVAGCRGAGTGFGYSRIS
jgi:hypothetical protein